MDYQQVAQKTTNEILRSNLEEVVFTEVLNDEGIKDRRSLVFITFFTFIIATLRPKFKTVFGFSLEGEAITNEVIQGVACLAIIYFLIKYIIELYLSFAAWRHKKSLVVTVPYIELISVIKENFSLIEKNVSNINRAFEGSSDRNSAAIQEVVATLNPTYNFTQTFKPTINPLLLHWQNTIEIIGKRTRVSHWIRIVAFVIVDILIPLGLSLLILAKCSDHIFLIIDLFWIWLGM